MRVKRIALATVVAIGLGGNAVAGTKGGLYDFSAMLNAPYPFAATGGVAAGAPPATVPVAPPAPTMRYVPQPQAPAASPPPATSPPYRRHTQASSTAPREPMATPPGYEGSGGLFERFYLSFGGGIDFPDDLGGRTSTGTQFNTELDEGYYLAMAFGRYVGKSWRGELELSYRSDDYGNTRAGAAMVSGNGQQTVTALMLNGFYDLRFGLPVVPFLGAGIGAAFIQGDDVGIGGGLAPGRDATEFAYQGIAGIGYDLGERWHVTLDGRYFGTGDDDVSSLSAGLNLRVDL
jgi:opacity protein-like surface antigen